jgi:hypothetical protein
MPVFGSATAATSASARWLQPVVILVWNGGLAMYAQQPEPVPSVVLVFHTVSVHPRVLLALTSEVPPTAVTFALVAGNCEPAPYSSSPALTVIATPGCW